MIKGCTKRVIVVKDIDSNFFDEAFFIVKPAGMGRASKESDFINEAHRIVKSDLKEPSSTVELPMMDASGTYIGKKIKPKLRDALMFVFGFGVSAVFCTFIYYSGILL